MSEDLSNRQTAGDPAPARSHLAAKRIIGVVSVLVFIGLLVWVTLKIGLPLLNYYFGGASASAEGTLGFRDMVAASPIKGRLIYVGIQILQVFIALIPGEVVEIAAGVAFGPFEGLALSLLGVAIGSSIVFLLTKTLGVRFVELFVSREKLNGMRFIRNDSSLNGLVFLVFFIPGTPKDVLTYFVGLTRMKLHTFLLISLFARIPSILTSTWGGDALIEGNYVTAAIIFGVTGVCGIAGLIIYNAVSKKRQRRHDAEQAALAAAQESAEDKTEA